MVSTLNQPDLFVQKEYQDRLERGLGDPERLQALYGSRFWNSPRQDQLGEFCKMAKQMLHADEAHITLVAADMQRIVASTETEMIDQTIDWSICQYMISNDGALEIESTLKTLRVCDVQSVKNGNVRAYLGVPLYTHDQHIIGGFCVTQHEERKWTQIDIMFLTKLAGALTTIHELQAQ